MAYRYPYDKIENLESIPTPLRDVSMICKQQMQESYGVDFGGQSVPTKVLFIIDERRIVRHMSVTTQSIDWDIQMAIMYRLAYGQTLHTKALQTALSFGTF